MYARIKRPVSGAAIEADIELAPLHGRRYERRKAFGAAHVVGRLDPRRRRLISQVLAESLPLFDELARGFVAEVHHAVDAARSGLDSAPGRGARQAARAIATPIRASTAPVTLV